MWLPVKPGHTVDNAPQRLKRPTDTVRIYGPRFLLLLLLSSVYLFFVVPSFFISKTVLSVAFIFIWQRSPLNACLTSFICSIYFCFPFPLFFFASGPSILLLRLGVPPARSDAVPGAEPAAPGGHASLSPSLAGSGCPLASAFMRRAHFTAARTAARRRAAPRCTSPKRTRMQSVPMSGEHRRGRLQFVLHFSGQLNQIYLPVYCLFVCY